MRFVVKPCTLAHLHWKTTSSDQFWYSHWSLFWSLVIIFCVCVLRRPQNLLHSFGIQWRTTRATKKCFQHIMMNLRCIGEITRKILLNYELNLNESFLRSPVAQRTIFRNRNSLKEKKSLGKIVNHGKKNHSLIFFVMKKIYHWTSTSCTWPGFPSFRQDISVANQLRPSCVHKSVRDINQLRANLNLGDKLPYVRALVKGIFRRTSRHVF